MFYTAFTSLLNFNTTTEDIPRILSLPGCINSNIYCTAG